jgi:hypothetical protein
MESLYVNRDSCEHLSGRIIRPKSLRLFPENA